MARRLNRAERTVGRPIVSRQILLTNLGVRQHSRVLPKIGLALSAIPLSVKLVQLRAERMTTKRNTLWD